VGLSNTATLVMFTALIAAASGSSGAGSSGGGEKKRASRGGWGSDFWPGGPRTAQVRGLWGGV